MAVENPPAFPANIGLDGSIYEGMSLRDWFAGQAMVGFLADGSQRLVADAIKNSDEGRLIDGYEALESVVAEQMAIGCYRLADAFLESRKVHENERD